MRRLHVDDAKRVCVGTHNCRHRVRRRLRCRQIDGRFRGGTWIPHVTDNPNDLGYRIYFQAFPYGIFVRKIAFCLRSQSHADTNFVRALSDGVCTRSTTVNILEQTLL